MTSNALMPTSRASPSRLSTMSRYLLSLVVLLSTAHGFVITPSTSKPARPPQPSTQVQLVAEVGAAVVLAGGAAAVWFSVAEDRDKQAQYAEWEQEAQERQEERARLAYIAPREEPSKEEELKPYDEEELKPYDGTINLDGPILIGAAGKVYNVWKGRNFYGPGGEYAIFAGRDATRLLGKFRTEEEDEESLSKPLTITERATLEGYVWTFQEKYEIVGTMADFDPKDTAMW